MNAQQALNEQEHNQVKQQIQLLEAKTSAEVVCAVATESGRYDRAESIVGIITAVFALGLSAIGCRFFAHPGDWHVEGASLLIQIISVVTGFVLGNYLAAWVHPLRRIFVSQNELTWETQRSAADIFFQHTLGDTRSQTGILIYISLFEHRIVILPDQQCREVLTDEVTSALCKNAAETMKTGSVSDVFNYLLTQLSDPLSESLPAVRQLNENELADHVLIL